MSRAPDIARVASLLSYCPDTGLLTWLVSRGKAKAGDVAGVDEGRYIVVGIDNKRYYAHRIVMLLRAGTWPEMVDHRDGDGHNNRWLNLRPATQPVNQQNQRTASRNNRLGLLGVRAFGGKFRSAICVDGKAKHLGTFDTPTAAHAAYLAAKRQLHEGCTI